MRKILNSMNHETLSTNKLIVGPEWDQRVIDMSLPSGKFGIFVSGGVDSGVLLHCLLENGGQYRHEDITVFTVDSPRDGSAVHSRNMIESACNYFKIPLLKQEFVGGETQLDKTITKEGFARMDQIVLDTKFSRRVKTIYTASNHTPPQEWFTIPGPTPWRAWRVDQKLVRTPFQFLYKYHILSIIKQRSWEHIYDVSHTCTEWVEGHCGECWQCSELKWAREQLL